MISRLKFRYGQHGSQPFIFSEIQQIHNRFPEAHTAGLGNIINLPPINSTPIGKEKKCVVGRSDKQMFDKIIFLGSHCCLAFTAAALISV
jgi:hypothetical protein